MFGETVLHPVCSPYVSRNWTEYRYLWEKAQKSFVFSQLSENTEPSEYRHWTRLCNGGFKVI